MGKRVLVFGTTMFSAEIAEILRLNNVEVLGFVVDAKFKHDDKYQNLPVFVFEDIEDHVDISTTEFALTLGYSEMNEYRELKYRICKSKGYQVFTFISPQAQVFSEQIGEGSLILPGAYVGPYSQLGICTVVRPGTVLAHHDLIGDYNWIADGCTFGGGVKMGSFCFIGLGTTIRNEISIADYTFIGAHSYIRKNTNNNGVYYGVPATETGKTSKDVIKLV